MTLFDQKFIENPQFLKWIFNSNPSVDNWWERYLLEHPEEASQLLELKKQLTELRFSNDSLTSKEKDELIRELAAKIELKERQNKHRTFTSSLLKYAAVALLLTAIGGLMVYMNLNKKTNFKEFAGQAIQVSSSVRGPVLITSNGRNIDLKKANSTVDYSKNGAIILNNDSVLEATVDETETIDQMVIPYGNQSKVVLSDNTVVWLNAGSRLVYPTVFKNKTREVLLFGEAFFEVSKNPQKPFIVKTSGIDIKVLGTKFNVSAYAEDEIVQTVLKEGSIAIRCQGAGLFEKDILIKPNQLASFNKTSTDTKIYEVDAERYILWTQGLISFDEIDFIRVIKKVERFYNISITFSDRQKEKMRISGKLDLKRSRSEVMEYLEKVSLSRFEQVRENQYTIK